MASIEEIKKVFTNHDQDKNGVLDVNEAQQAFKALGPAAKPNLNFEEHFQRLAKGGTITFDDFKTFVNN
ncbi:hypothetical protein M3Y99_00274500 [Aphelenchoides fujianensis]|nr:hypothetical protein M3Y99_01672700 [Aphelenchoides fujianensis]KAI6229801.1 hypothetical protein M3Y99_01139100 [Aphelenchoides fujianensis]KAI6241983.1 hypothetical protein M3Y99_00274500 [Aphelenchoides fujianensis]